MRKKLGEILLANRLITASQLEEALTVQKDTKQPLGAILISLGFVSEQLLLQVLAAQQGVGAWHIEKDPPTQDAMAMLPISICAQYQMIPVQVRGDLLLVAMRDPGDLDAIDFARNVTHMRVESVLAEEHKLAAFIERMEREGRESMVIGDKVDLALNSVVDRTMVSKREDVELAEEDTRPVVALVNQILTDAIRMGSSDIHFEPRTSCVELRFRVDGELVKVREIPDELQGMLTTRIKIMADLDIVESRLPQNGRISVKIDGRQVDLRVSTLPNIHGQRIVLRILDKSKALKSLEELGFDAHNLGLYRKLIKKPYGIFLVSGPTGSGKTTSLYAALSEIKSVKTNIMTCEDPVEYDIPGLNQSQINDKVGLTFDVQLKAILRQDPDVVLVGEIRDQQTAETAIRAAMTGHLVLSTLHSNDAASSIPRLLDMGIDPFLVSNSLVGVMGQRLIRKVCPHCAVEVELTDFERKLYHRYMGAIDLNPVLKATGCAKCFTNGYRGRTGVHEILPIEDDMRELISQSASLDSIREAAKGIGYRSMQQDVLQRVLSHETTMEEAFRTIYFDTLVTEASESPTILRAA
ncbi:MAG: Flp pilus assembly complex ATPase component TadA [Armatimonadetes bacterium]|nr:Flp pilus assembly complex ATPase component TadA [Armatimonadota bacterium]